VDAAFELDTRRGPTGVVVPDDKGNFLAANNNPIDYALDATTSEAMAIRHGLYLANQLGANKLIVQSDCKEMIEV
jgi:ribonuclease HI